MNQTQRQRDEPAVSIRELGLCPGHERLQQRRADVSIASAAGDEAASQRRHAHNFLGRLSVENGSEQRQHVLAIGTGVGEAETEDGTDLQDGGRVSDVVGEESERWVAVVPDASVDDATSERSATLDVILRGVQVFVNLRETAIDVPEK